MCQELYSTWIISFSPQNSSLIEILVLFPFYKAGSRDKLSNLFKVIDVAICYT